MEQFKINVSKCTEDEKRQIWNKFHVINRMHGTESQPCTKKGVWYYVTGDKITGWDTESNADYENWDIRPASDFLTRFQTRPHDYTGCHPDIAAAVKRGEDIFCEDSALDEGWVYGWDADVEEYRTVNGIYLTANAEPIPAEPKKKAVTLELTDAQLAKIKEVIGETE